MSRRKIVDSASSDNTYSLIASRSRIFLFNVLPILVFSFLYFSTYYNVLNEPASIKLYRLLRIYYVLLSGFILGASGSILQSVLRNPLVDHYVIGIGSGALFAVYMTVYFYTYHPLLIVLAGIIGGLTALGLTILIAEKLSGSDIAYVLSGIGVATLFSGASSFILFFIIVKYPYASLMTTGSFSIVDSSKLVYVHIPLLIILITYYTLAKKLNTVIFGDDFAKQLGVDPGKTRLLGVLVAGVSSSIIVSLFGIIGFLGLITPHIARFLLKTSDNRLTIPFSGTIGMVILALADTVSRSITTIVSSEIPAGSIISLIGAPFFLLLLISRFTRWSK